MEIAGVNIGQYAEFEITTLTLDKTEVLTHKIKGRRVFMDDVTVGEWFVHRAFGNHEAWVVSEISIGFQTGGKTMFTSRSAIVQAYRILKQVGSETIRSAITRGSKSITKITEGADLS